MRRALVALSVTGSALHVTGTRGLSSASGSRFSLRVRGVEAMERLAGSLAQGAARGDAVLLIGDLGVGKTCFARGFVRAVLDDPLARVTSPSYLLDNTYEAAERGLVVHHMDLYRLKEGADLDILGIEDAVRDCVSLIEWPDRRLDKYLPDERLEVRISAPDADEGAGAADEGAADPGGEEFFVTSGTEDEERVVELLPFGPRWLERARGAASEFPREDGALEQ